MAESKGAVRAAVVLFDQVLNGSWIDFESKRSCLFLNQITELNFGRVANFDFVRDTAQERFVEQVFRLEVRGENQEFVERHLDLAAAGEVEEVVVLFQRNDQAIEDFGAAHALAAEV